MSHPTCGIGTGSCRATHPIEQGNAHHSKKTSNIHGRSYSAASTGLSHGLKEKILSLFSKLVAHYKEWTATGKNSGPFTSKHTAVKKDSGTRPFSRSSHAKKSSSTRKSRSATPAKSKREIEKEKAEGKYWNQCTRYKAGDYVGAALRLAHIKGIVKSYLPAPLKKYEEKLNVIATIRGYITEGKKLLEELRGKREENSSRSNITKRARFKEYNSQIQALKKDLRRAEAKEAKLLHELSQTVKEKHPREEQRGLLTKLQKAYKWAGLYQFELMQAKSFGLTEEKLKAAIKASDDKFNARKKANEELKAKNDPNAHLWVCGAYGLVDMDTICDQADVARSARELAEKRAKKENDAKEMQLLEGLTRTLASFRSRSKT